MIDRHKLMNIARKGPLLRGTQEWDDRELARRSLGCQCLSFGSLREAKWRKEPIEFNLHKP